MAEPQQTHRAGASHPSVSPGPGAAAAAPGSPVAPAAALAPATAIAPFPPGDTGSPLLGETLPFLKDGFGFVASRTARHGPIWKTRILGRPTAVLVGPDASGRFIDSEVQRAGAMPHVQELFGGASQCAASTCGTPTPSCRKAPDPPTATAARESTSPPP